LVSRDIAYSYPIIHFRQAETKYLVLVHIISDTFADYRLFSHVVQSFKAVWVGDGRGTNYYPPWQGLSPALHVYYFADSDTV